MSLQLEASKDISGMVTTALIPCPVQIYTCDMDKGLAPANWGHMKTLEHVQHWIHMCLARLALIRALSSNEARQMVPCIT